jgi:hypothetical protein
MESDTSRARETDRNEAESNGTTGKSRTIEFLHLAPVSEERFSELVLKSLHLTLTLTRERTGLLIGPKNDEPVKYALNRAVSRRCGWEDLFTAIEESNIPSADS